MTTSMDDRQGRALLALGPVLFTLMDRPQQARQTVWISLMAMGRTAGHSTTFDGEGTQLIPTSMLFSETLGSQCLLCRGLEL